MPTVTARAPKGPALGLQALAAALTLAAVVLAGGYVARAKLKRPPAHEPAPPTTSVATTSSTVTSSHPTADAQVELTIKASPPEARISIDGAPANGNPTTAIRPRDGAIHLIRIEAPGYETREESLGFDRSVYLNIDLHPAGGTADSAPSSPSGKGGKKTTLKGPHPRSSAAKNIDAENPY
jgi:serine/threonine-protein kinase